MIYEQKCGKCAVRPYDLSPLIRRILLTPLRKLSIKLAQITIKRMRLIKQ